MNIKLFARLCLIGMLAVFTVEKASAVPYNLTFTASGATILGGIIFDKSATDFSVISLISTDLTIEGHLYSIGDLHSDIADPNVRICSAPNCEVANATNDFLVRYNRTTGAFNDFVLGTPFSGTDSGTTTFTQGQQASAVPGPSRRRWLARPDLGRRWPSRLVAAAADAPVDTNSSKIVMVVFIFSALIKALPPRCCIPPEIDRGSNRAIC